LLIIGCGPIGALCALASRCLSQRPLLVSDINKARQADVAAMAGGTGIDLMGFDQFISGCKTPVRHVLDTTGNIGVISKLIADLSGCKLGLVGIGFGALSFDPVHLVEQELTLIGCHAFTDELPRAIELLEQQPDLFAGVIGTYISLEDTPQTYQDIVAGSAKGIKTLLAIHGDNDDSGETDPHGNRS